MSVENDIQLIERYLDGDLSPEELQAFEERRAADPEFAQLVQAGDLVVAGIRQAGEEETLGLLQNIHEEEMGKKEKPQARLFTLRRTLAVAATLALLIVAGWFLLRPTAPSSDQLFASYYQPPAFEQTRSGAATDPEGADQLWTDAGQAFQTGDYETALNALNQYLSLIPENATALRYKAICQIELQEYDAALSTLGAIKDHPDWMEEARWLSALIHLRQNDKQAALAQLDDLLALPALTSSMEAKAQELRKKVVRIKE